MTRFFVFFLGIFFLLAASGAAEIGEKRQDVLARRGPPSREIPDAALEGIHGDLMWVYSTPTLAILFRQDIVVGEKEKRHSDVTQVMPESVLLYPPRIGDAREKGGKTLTWFYENPLKKWVMHRLLCRQIDSDSTSWDPTTGKLTTVKAPWKNYVVEWSLVVERDIYEAFLKETERKTKKGGKP